MTTVTRNNSQRGFSLLEVLIAVVVMSLGLLALASLQSNLIRSAADAKAQSLAMAAAKQKIELLQSVESFGGTDNTCVSPTSWTGAAVSCYRAITDEAMPTTGWNVDGDPTTAPVNQATIEPLGGIEFRLGTTVTRYVFNKSTNAYASVSDTALTSALTTSPTTYIPGKEFKRVSVTVAWTDAANAARSITVEDSIPGVVPRDSIALLLGKKGVLPRKAEAVITNPGAVAGVIPIAVGNGSNTAASNPTPELLGAQNNTYVSETRFDVYTYIPLTDTTALAQSRVETAVVGCRCDTATASTTEIPLRPTYWEGLRYAIPTEANYVGLTLSAPTANRPLAGPKALANGELAQSDQCRVCCRDHHDPAGNDANGDPYSAVAKVSPRRSSHTHFLVDPNNNGARTLVTSGPYSEVCRMIRVDGIFRVAADLNNDYFALLEARNSGVSSFVPSTVVAEDYGDMVKKYLKARFSSNNTPSTFNTTNSPDPYSYAQGTRTLADTTTRAYDLNLPSTYFLKLTSDAKWLHARGLYIDYLEPAAIARIVAAQSCGAADSNECVLPFLPFTSINLSELAEWKDLAVAPTPTSVAQVISVLNNGFNTATGDATYTAPVQAGGCCNGSTTIDFPARFSDSIVAGMAVAGTGVAANARVVSVNNQHDRVVVDLPNTANVTGTVTFQAAPVRAIVKPGTAPASGNTSDAQATASYNNAAVALKFPMHGDETVLTDSQRFTMSASGSPPDPTAGSFDVTFSVGYSVDSSHPKVAWGIGNATPSVLNACNLVGAALPFVCPATSGLGGGMSILIGDYNVGGNVKNYTLPWNTCKIKSGSGSTYLAYTAFTGTQTSTVSRPYVLNYTVASASTSGVAGSGVVTASGTTPYTVTGSPTAATQLANETTELFFNKIALPVAGVKDLVTVSLVKEADPDGEISANLTCCLIKQTGSTFSLNSVTWAPNACSFPLPP